MIEKEYKEKLKKYLEEGLSELVKNLQVHNKELTPIKVYSYIRNRHARGLYPKYSNEELNLLFEYYQQYIEKINEFIVFPPTQKNFCGLCGISSNMYNTYRESDDSNRREIMQKIDDYITDQSLALAQAGAIKEVTTIYRTKAENKMIEAQAPVQNNTQINIDLSEIRANVKAIKDGKMVEVINESEKD